MIAGLKLLEKQRAKKAYVDCDLDEAANRLYESVGFVEYDQVYCWQKEF
jgi:hypothetical protein